MLSTGPGDVSSIFSFNTSAGTLNGSWNETTRVTKHMLFDSMDEVASEIKTWEPADYIVHGLIQKADRNHGSVDLVSLKIADGKFAVKVMPNAWVRSGPLEFLQKYPTGEEFPWHDIGLVKVLKKVGYPYSNHFLGLFRDDKQTYFATSLATEGDLFKWCQQGPEPGYVREQIIVPLVIQLFSAVRLLHDLGVAHRDLSLENILLTDTGDGDLKVKIIDFGMATLTRMCRKQDVGKPSYQAPELHETNQYDAFLADCFSLGVVLFSMAAHDYPWTSTVPGTCQLYRYFRKHGFVDFVKKRRSRSMTSERLFDVFSPELIDLLDGLLQAEPTRRVTLGQCCYIKSLPSRKSIWDFPWMHIPIRGGKLASV